MSNIDIVKKGLKAWEEEGEFPAVARPKLYEAL